MGQHDQANDDNHSNRYKHINVDNDCNTNANHNRYPHAFALRSAHRNTYAIHPADRVAKERTINRCTNRPAISNK